MGREEFEQRNLDQVEENKLIAREHATQLHLLGIRNDRWGCPHYHGQPEGSVAATPTRCEPASWRGTIPPVFSLAK